MMRRRTFIMALGGAAAWPLAAGAQQPERTRLIGVLMGGAETDFESPARVKAFEETLARLGWTVGRNLRIEYRWTRADSERTRTGALELLRMAPDVLIGDGGTRAAALVQASRTVPIVFVLAIDPWQWVWCRVTHGPAATRLASQLMSPLSHRNSCNC
jgi:putative tryptophan/tyrosine transport system substrate-binding protein